MNIAPMASAYAINVGDRNTVTGQVRVIRSNYTTTQNDSVDLRANKLNLADNPFHQESAYCIPLTADAKALPKVMDVGKLHDQHEATSPSKSSNECLAAESRMRVERCIERLWLGLRDAARASSQSLRFNVGATRYSKGNSMQRGGL